MINSKSKFIYNIHLIATIKISLKTVVTAAPIYEKCGINKKFKTTLNRATMKYILVTVTSLCEAFKSVFPTPLTNNRHTVQIKILKTGAATSY